MIDLGLVTPAGPPAAQTAARRPVRRTTRAGVGLAGALLAVVMSAVGGSTAPPGPVFIGPVTVSGAGALDVTAAGDTLYVSRREAMLAYSMRTGTLRWTLPLPPRSGVVVVRAGGVALIGVAGGHWQTIAVDAASGTPRWRAEGVPLSWGTGQSRVALATAAVFNDDVSGDGPPRMTIVDTGTGAELARVPVAAGHGGPTFLPIVAPTPRGLEVVGVRTFSVTGEPRWYELDSGTERSLPAGAATAADEFLAVDDVLVAVNNRASGVRAYGQADTRLRWTLGGRGPITATPCGTDVCISGPDGTKAINPRTGSLHWLSPWTNVTGTGRRLLGYRYGPVGPTDVVVLDSATGRELLRLPEWLPAHTDDPAWVPVLRSARANGGYELAMLSAERAAAYRVGVLGSVADCRALPGYLVCHTAQDGIKVWRQRPDRAS